MQELLSTFGIDWQLILAQAVNFGIVLVVLTYFLYKPVMKTLDERREKIAKGVEDAEKAEKALLSADEEAKKRTSEADGKAEAIVASAREAATLEKERIVREAEARAKALETSAEARAEETKARALRESDQEIARLAILAAGKALAEGKTST